MKIKKGLLFLLLIVLVPTVYKLFSFSVNDDDAEFRKQFNDKYYVFALTTPKELGFCGERVPVGSFDVRERLDRELLLNTYWQSQAVLFLKRSYRWFPVIEPILKQNGVPDDFKYLALAESGFINVVSPAGAVGYWQFMENTAKTYGLEVNNEVDERYNVEKSTDAACKYLREAHRILGSWTLAAASYNMGIVGVQKQIEKQRVKSYYDLMLNDETFRYVFRLLALKEIISHPTNYGYHLRKQDFYQPLPCDNVTVDSSVNNFVEFALKHKINYKILKLMNPWLRDNKLSNKLKKTYTVKILKPGFEEVTEFLSDTLSISTPEEPAPPVDEGKVSE